LLARRAVKILKLAFFLNQLLLFGCTGIGRKKSDFVFHGANGVRQFGAFFFFSFSCAFQHKILIFGLLIIIKDFGHIDIGNFHFCSKDWQAKTKHHHCQNKSCD